jgi:UDP-N-acetylmuramate dehydrogenase
MKILENISLADHTTFKIGGSVRYFAVAESESDLLEALAFAKDKGVPFFILGGGSNLLASDQGFLGLVIKMEMKGVSVEKRRDAAYVSVSAGENWDEFVAKTVEEGLWGLENLSLIPGTVGAAPVQNIGAYGVEVMSLIESVRTIDVETGTEKIFSNAECGFTYRDSVFKKLEFKRYVIVSVEFKLSLIPRPILGYKDLKERFVGKNPTHREIREAVIEIREGKFPDISKVGTAGSFWKNPIICREHYEGIKKHFPNIPSFPATAPAGSREVESTEEVVKVPLAWILDNVCGLKGYKKGKVGLYEKQPLVLVADRGATSSDIDAFASEIAAKVKEKTGIEIEREVQSL